MKQLTFLVWLIVSASMLHAAESCDKFYYSFFNFNSEEVDGASAEAAIANTYIKLLDQVLARLNAEEQQKYLRALSTDLFAELSSVGHRQIPAYQELHRDDIKDLISNGSSFFKIDSENIQGTIKNFLNLKIELSSDASLQQQKVLEETRDHIKPFLEFKGNIENIDEVFSFDDESFFGIGKNGEIAQWSYSDPGKPKARFIGHKGTVDNFLKINSQNFVTISWFMEGVKVRSQMFLWDINNPNKPIKSFAKSNSIYSALKLVDEKSFIATTDSGEIKLINIYKPNSSNITYIGNQSRVTNLEILNENEFITAHFNGDIVLRNIHEPRHIKKFRSGSSPITMLISMENNKFITMDWENRLTLWDVAKSSSIQKIKVKKDNQFGLHKINDSIFVTKSKENDIWLWDLKDLSKPSKIFSINSIGQNGSTFMYSAPIKLNDEEFVATTSEGEMLVWNIMDVNYPKLRLLGHGDGAIAVAVIGNEQIFSIYKGNVFLWRKDFVQ